MTADITAALEQVREWEKEKENATAWWNVGHVYRNTGLKLVEALVAWVERGDFWGVGDETYDKAQEALTEFAEEVERLK